MRKRGKNSGLQNWEIRELLIGARGITNIDGFRDFKVGQKDYKLGQRVQIGAKSFQNGVENTKRGKRDFKLEKGLQIGAEQCYSTNVRLFTYLNEKVFSRELKKLNYDELW